jgi:hypothetical protein
MGNYEDIITALYKQNKRKAGYPLGGNSSERNGTPPNSSGFKNTSNTAQEIKLNIKNKN